MVNGWRSGKRSKEIMPPAQELHGVFYPLTTERWCRPKGGLEPPRVSPHPRFATRDPYRSFLLLAPWLDDQVPLF